MLVIMCMVVQSQSLITDGLSVKNGGIAVIAAYNLVLSLLSSLAIHPTIRSSWSVSGSSRDWLAAIVLHRPGSSVIH